MKLLCQFQKRFLFLLIATIAVFAAVNFVGESSVIAQDGRIDSPNGPVGPGNCGDYIGLSTCIYSVFPTGTCGEGQIAYDLATHYADAFVNGKISTGYWFTATTCSSYAPGTTCDTCG